MVLAKIRDQFRYVSRGRGWTVSLSIGAVCYAHPPDSVEEMVKSADNLMYEVKQGGKDNYRISLAS